MEPPERDFWIAVALWGSAFVTVFGCGLYAFMENSWRFGSAYSLVGLGGLIYMTVHLRGRRLTTNPAVAAVLVATWAFFAYTIWFENHLPGVVSKADYDEVVSQLVVKQKLIEQLAARPPIMMAAPSGAGGTGGSAGPGGAAGGGGSSSGGGGGAGGVVCPPSPTLPISPLRVR